MNRHLTLAVASVISAAGLNVALAADMPIKAPPLAVSPAYDWSGFYVGLNGGWGWQESRPGITLSNGPVIATTPGLRASGGFGGGQAGYNWQQGPIVVGVEGDIQGSSIKDSLNRVVDAAADNLLASTKTDYFGTIRGRVGAAVDHFLIYGTAGIAFAHVTNSEFVSNPTTVAIASGSNSSTKTGAAFGAGAEYAINRSWSVKAEYLWIGIGGDTLALPIVPPPGAVTSSHLTDNFQIVRVGVNYKFGAPVVAKY
jgi:outer membrane immunogenic protein